MFGFRKHIIEETPSEKVERFVKKNRTTLAAIGGAIIGAGAYALGENMAPKMTSADFLKGLRGKGGEEDV